MTIQFEFSRYRVICMTAISFVTFFVLSICKASVIAFSGEGSEKLFIESASDLGKDVYLLKFEGIDSPWAGKVIKTTREVRPSGERYGFTYDLELSSGVQQKSYNILVEAGKTLKNGSMLRQMDLYHPKAGQKAPRLVYDEALSKQSQKLGLVAEYKKTPYKPEVD